MTISRRTLLTGALATPIALQFSVLPANAASHMEAVQQVVALQRVKAGEAVVTAISDGYLALDASLLSNITPEEANAALAAQFIGQSPVTTGVNTYLVTIGDRKILVDAGGAGLSPTLGNLLPSLKAAGVAPGDVETILMTHLHVDHIGGLLAEGKPAFPNADLYIHEKEVAFWTSAENKAAAPEMFKASFDAAKAAVDAYGDKVKTFAGDAEVVPGILSRELFGHTPGHTGYVVGTGTDALMIWGDIVHVGPIQMAKPDVGIAFDSDPAGAIATRKAVLDMAAKDKVRVAGMHIAFPGIGHVVKLETGDGYDFEPSPWSYAL